MPFGNPQRANDVALSLHSCLRETRKIQRLRLPLKVQRQTDRARIFAISFCLKFARTRARRRWQKNLLPCLRDTSVLVLGLPSANARFEFAYLREKMSKARATRPFRAAGFQRALGPLVRFLGSFFLGRERMNINVPRTRTQCSVSDRLRRYKEPHHPIIPLFPPFVHTQFPFSPFTPFSPKNQTQNDHKFCTVHALFIII